MLRIVTSLKGAERAQRALRQLHTRLGPGNGRLALMSRIGTALLRWVDQNFSSGGGLVGGWAPLRSSTIFARRMGSSVPLSNVGAAGLRGSFTYEATEDEVVVGSPKQIAKYHQYGTRPYIIRPKKPGGVLAFLMPPGSSISSRRGLTSLRRRKEGTPRVGIVSAKAARLGGMSIPGGRGDLQSLMFTRVVHHPGLPARRMLPNRAEAAPVLNDVVADLLAELKGLAEGGRP